MKTLIAGLGNPILGDDGVGWKVVDELQKLLPEDAPFDLLRLSVGGISLMEHLIGYDHAVLIDAFAAGEETGSILVLKLDELQNYSAYHIASVHDTSLQNAIELGRVMGAPLPDDVTIVGISTRSVFEFSEDLSPAAAASVPYAARIVLNLLEEIRERDPA
jgi:hydrogenase maturation protease